MPDTGSPWNLPYEHPNDLPTKTLNGGLTGSDPILARVIHEKLEQLITPVLTDYEDRITTLEGLLDNAMVRVATLDVAGLGISTASIVIPTGYKHLGVHWHGIHNAAGGAGRASLMVRLNGDVGNNYGHSGFHTDEPGGDATVYDAPVTGTSMLRVGYVGSAIRSGGVFWIQHVDVANTMTAHGTCEFNGTSNARALGMAGGSWNGTPPLTSINVAPLSNNWTAGRVSVYGLK